MRKHSKKIIIIIFMLLLTLSFGKAQIAKAGDNLTNTNIKSTVSVKTPKNFRIKRKSDTSLKLKWKKVDEADGYIIYRYNKKEKKYVRIKNIKSPDTTKWVNKNLKTNKTYKYKISAYKKVNGKKIYSKKSYWIKAKPYKRNAKSINAGRISVKGKVTLGLTMSVKMEPYVIASKYGTNKKKKSFSQKVRWSSSNKKIATVSKDGTITAGVQTGTCYVYAKAHNGVTKRIKVKVKNYARPDEFYFNEERWRTSTLLEDYKTEICNIASYYTINNVGVDYIIRIHLDSNLEIVASPDTAKIGKEILDDIKKILMDFPTDVYIEVAEDSISFIMYYSVTEHNRYEVVDYYIYNNCSKYDTKIASHWDAWEFMAEK